MDRFHHLALPLIVNHILFLGTLYKVNPREVHERVGLCNPTTVLIFFLMGHFRVPPGLCIKTRLSAQPLIWKRLFVLMQIKLLFTRKVEHLASF